MDRQEVDINPERPIRIHETPVQVGQQDFLKAIEKSADILRFHPRSRYVDNAIEIIGQSYFYQGQFFSASQKFLELYNTTPDDKRKQTAVYWRGRSFLELESYIEGLTYLKSQQFASDLDWDEEIEAEIKLIIGQLHVNNREWEDAELYLSEGKEGITDRKKLARAHFLHGQVLEKLERYEDAMVAYELANNRSNPEFSITYNARKKMAQIARKTGDYQWSYDYLVSMTRDDNYFEFLGDLLYEVARTLQEGGDDLGAKEEYQHLLRQNLSTPSREAIAKTYYGLAEIHRDYHQDYAMAAAYFDSSASQATELIKLPETFDARLMADSYGNYSNLVEREQRLDSLLWLGSLPEAEFDSVIATVREKKILEMERQMEEQERAGDRIVSAEDIEATDVTEDTENGFLNHLNPQIMNQVSMTFRAYWGNRPLVDDWRRAEAVRLAIRSGNRNGDDTSEDETITDDEFLEGGGDMNNQVIVDLSEIPFTEKDRAESREQIAQTNYEIANVFFLTLNMPDSAQARYLKVMNNFPESKMAPQAMYSLSETYNAVDDSIQARQVAEELIEKYPYSHFATRVAERHDIPMDYEPVKVALSRQDSLNIIYLGVLQKLENGNVTANIERLKTFAQDYADSEKAPQALYRAATEYLNLARIDPEYQERLSQVNKEKEQWEQKQNSFNELQDSSLVMLEDSTLSDEERNQWQVLSDSALAQPDSINFYPYEGVHWDSARVLLTKLSQNYASFQAMERVERLREEIKEIKKEPVEAEEELDANVISGDLLDEVPQMVTELDEFLKSSGLQDQVNSMMESTTFTLMVTVNEEGELIEVVSVDEAHEGSPLLENLVNALKEDMRFTPPLVNEEPVTAQWQIYIPVEFQ